MDFIHCNACQVAPSAEYKSFWFTNCMHIYCKNCVQKFGIPKTTTMQCMHCKKPCNVIEIGPNMPPKVKRLFTPLEQVLKDQAATMKRVCKFQEEQLLSLMDFAKKEKEALKRAGKAFQQAKAQMSTLTKEKSELEGTVIYHKKRLEEFERHIKELQSTIQGGRRTPIPPMMSGAGPSFMNVTSQSDPTSFYGIDASMRTEVNMSMDSSSGDLRGFLTGSAPSTPLCSQLSNGEMTTPRMLGLPKKGTGVRSDNPYMAMWNRTSVERQKRASGGGIRVKPTDVTETSESPLARISSRMGPSSGFR